MMKRSNIQPLALLLALMFVLLPGCAETGTAEISEDVYAAAGDGQIVDIRDRYTADGELHGSDAGAPVQTLLLDNAEDNERVSSEALFEISEDANTRLGITASWRRSGETLYVGVASAEGTIYALGLTSGAAHGIIDLSGLPADEYAVTMFSGNDADVFASLSYQIA